MGKFNFFNHEATNENVKPVNISYKKSFSAEEKYKILIENLPFAFILLDSKGLIKEINDTTTKLLGYLKEELIGKSFSSFSNTLQENFHFF